MPQYTDRQNALAEAIDRLNAEMHRLERRGLAPDAVREIKRATRSLALAYDALPESRPAPAPAAE